MAHWDDLTLWVVDHHGDGVLRLGGVGPLESWKAGATTLTVPPRRTDGLIEARRVGETRDRLYYVEVGTYPERRLENQMWEGVLRVV
ncbi:MAG: hypothetical protein FJX77_16585, partial [Armatimonadetes bacterium]|nr:hypothetical protein [Armatimonadota bacterium]